MSLRHLLVLMRCDQYIKNFFIFAPIFFSMNFTNLPLLFHNFIAFIAFSLTASGIYIMNDYKDLDDDRKHPRKRNRPLAAGHISKSQGLTIMGILLLVGLGIMFYISVPAVCALVVYVLLNVMYSYGLKHIAIVDVVVIAVGFLLRLIVGSLVSGVYLSHWIVVMTFLLSLFLAFAKRRDDIILFQNTGKMPRKVLSGYNLKFLDAAMSIMASVIIVAYIIYATANSEVSESGEYLYLTSFFVVLGMLRYLQISLVFKGSGSPTDVVVRDRFLQVVIFGWIFSFAWILY